MKKRRTRSHVIADLSVNHVERYVLRCGYTVERVAHDYGIDLVLHTYDSNGVVEVGAVLVQLKATDSLPLLEDRETIPFAVARGDLERRLEESVPVLLILYDAPGDTAYWPYVQAYFARRGGWAAGQAGNTVTLHLSRANRVDENAVRRFAGFKAGVQQQIQGVVHFEN